MSEDVAITVSNLTKSYKLYESHADRVKELFNPFRNTYHRSFDALHDISFFVRKGETIGIIGRNGSGKSTLLQILCGILRPSSGGYRVSGKLSALLELGAGFNPEFTGIENVYLNGSIMGFSKAEMDEKLDDILAFADIGDFVYQPVKTYSSGMAVRLAFSIYSVVDPDVFVVDEALAVGDAYFVHRCMLRFHDMQRQKKTIILVSHDPSAIKKLCHKTLWLEQGQVAMFGDSSEVVDAYIEDLFKHVSVQGSDSDSPAPSIVSDSGGVDQEDVRQPETTIEHFDRRLGTQELIIQGAGLYSTEMKPVKSVTHGTSIIVRMSVRNNSLEGDFAMACGYIFRDFKGIEIASVNSRIEGLKFPSLKREEVLTLRMEIELPMLYPGSYSITPSVSYLHNGEHVICDRLINALILEITTETEMHVLMRFPTTFELEHVLPL